MKKIYPIFEILSCVCLTMFLCIIVIFSMVKFYENAILRIIICVCITLIIALLLKLFYFSSHIILSNMVRVFDYPLFATNNFYEKKSSLIDYNSKIIIKEIEKIELVKLKKKEQKKHVGYIHIFSKYLKISLKHGCAKYVYVGTYSNYQINKIVHIMEKLLYMKDE